MKRIKAVAFFTLAAFWALAARLRKCKPGKSRLRCLSTLRSGTNNSSRHIFHSSGMDGTIQIQNQKGILW